MAKAMRVYGDVAVPCGGLRKLRNRVSSWSDFCDEGESLLLTCPHKILKTQDCKDSQRAEMGRQSVVVVFILQDSLLIRRELIKTSFPSALRRSQSFLRRLSRRPLFFHLNYSFCANIRKIFVEGQQPHK